MIMMKIISPLLLLLLLMIITIKTMMIIMIKHRITMKILNYTQLYENKNGNILKNLSSLAKLEYNLSHIPPIYNIHVILCPIILQHLE